MTSDEVVEALLRIKTESVGMDGIPLKFVKLILPVILPFLTHLFNFSLTSSTFPTQWKTAKLIPIPKISSPSSTSDFRPISILSSLSKALEYLINKQLCDYLTSFKLISGLQSGFRSKHTTSSALLKITHDMYSACDRKHVNILVLLDYAKAFDSVPYNILLKKMELLFNFSSNLIKLLTSYLKNRIQCVSVSSSFSNCVPVVSGIPQGSILGPLLFLMFINDFPSNVQHSKCHLFADDVQLYISCPFSDLVSATEEVRFAGLNVMD